MVKKAKTPKNVKSSKKGKVVKKKNVVEEDVVEEKAVTVMEDMEFDEETRPDYLQDETVNVEIDSVLDYPTIKLLQALSPEIDEEDEKFIDDAEAGDILISDGQDSILIDKSEGIKIVPILVRKLWVEWIPRKLGGGFVDSYSDKQSMEQNRNPKNDIVVSIDYLALTWDLDPEADEPSLVLLQFNSKTKMVPARTIAQYANKHNTLSGITYMLKSKRVKNKANQTYYNFAVTPDSWTESTTYELLQDLVDQNKDVFLPLSQLEDSEF